MGNPIKSKTSLTSCIFDQCCCCFTLRTGTMIIGILQLIFAILWLISATTQRGAAYTNFVTVILTLIAGILIIIGVQKNAAEKLWWGVYLNLIIIIWAIIIAIILFVQLLWSAGIGILINAVFEFYFVMVVRSYAFEVEDGGTVGSNPA